jgi:Tol biopolymer transport system component
MQRTLRRLTVGIAIVVSIGALLVPASPASAASKLVAHNGLASVSTSAKVGNKASFEPSVSSGGRFIAFSSIATDLVAGDGNAKGDVFVRDTLADTTVLASVTSGGSQGNGVSDQPSISADGRYVAFRSAATNLVVNDLNATTDIFVRDLVGKTTIRASLRWDNTQSNGDASHPVISDDGKTVTFQSSDDSLVSGSPSNGKDDIYVRNTQVGLTERATVTSAETGLSAGGVDASMSGNGRYVVFTSETTQIGTDTNGGRDVFLRDRTAGTTERVSITSSGDAPTGQSIDASVSDDGRYVAFQSDAHNMTADDTGPTFDGVYRRDRTLGTTLLLVRSFAGTAAGGDSAGGEISANGLRVAFTSSAANLVPGDTNAQSDVFVRDIPTATTTMVSTTTAGTLLSGSSMLPSMSPDGGYVAYESLAKNGYPADTNTTFDVFWRGRFQIGPFTNSTALLQQQGKDFTGAALPIGTLVAMNDRILLGTRNPGGAIVDLAHGAFDDHRGPVIRLYWAFFERLPDQGGLDYWVGKHAGGTTLKQIAQAFAKSSEFQNHYGPLTDTDFVTLVYQNVLERNPDAPGLAHWIDRIQHGVSRGEMMTGFSESSEGIRRMRGEVDTVLLYAGMLRRLPTKVEFTNAVALLEAVPAQPSELLAMNLLISGEYAARFP